MNMSEQVGSAQLRMRCRSGPGRASRELLASFDQRLAEPLRRWEAEQAAQAGGRRALG
jgi:hypothetical protein